jgi:hypothetical protein
MVRPAKTSGKVVQFAMPQPSREDQLEKWFRGVMQSNRDLVTALERLRDSYKVLLTKRPVSEADHAILKAVEIILNSAKNAQVF